MQVDIEFVDDLPVSNAKRIVDLADEVIQKLKESPGQWAKVSEVEIGSHSLIETLIAQPDVRHYRHSAEHYKVTYYFKFVEQQRPRSFRRRFFGR